MSKSIILAIVMLSSMILCGQNLKITFTASGAAYKVDSVKATNLRTNENVTLPGNDTLILAFNSGTGITSNTEMIHQGTVYPNPFPGKTTFVADVLKAQTLTLEVYTLTGQSVARTQALVQPGSHKFELSLSKAGIYMISVTSDQGTEGFKIMCSESSGTENMIRFKGHSPDNKIPLLKKMNLYTLGYTNGDIILYRCRGGVHITIITDSPTLSKNYEVEFAPCIDPDGKSYAIVKIGTQTWMAENLAWLPSVSVSSKDSDSLKYYYVYDYEDSIVNNAKKSVNYKLYGVLYNWPAAMNKGGQKELTMFTEQGGCPTGWHLPDDNEWKNLEMNLGMGQTKADSLYWRNSGEVGIKLKSSINWFGNGTGSNSSGFTALPGGYLNTHGSFRSIASYAVFWSASKSDTLPWYRSLHFNDNGSYRFTTMPGHGFSVRCVKND